MALKGVVVNTESKKRLLVVEDEEDVRVYLSVLFTDMGFEVETAENGKKAWEIIKASRPDLITLDIVAPGKSGMNFYRELREDRAFADIPVVIITGLQQDFRKFIYHGKNTPPPDGYVSKPFEQETLFAEIEKALKKTLPQAVGA
jgi:CheY-like chemotaxis protein